MTVPLLLHPETMSHSTSEAAKPKILTRTFLAPAGWPWDQGHAARLDARHSAPLPLSELRYQVRRLTPWRPGVSSRFACFYVRSSELTGRLESTVAVNEQAVQVIFETPTQRVARAKKLGVIAVGVAATLAILVWGLATALSARATAESQLGMLEARAETSLARARDLRAAADVAGALANADPGQQPDAVLSDIAWTVSAKNPAAHFDAWHWKNGLMVVEVRGGAAPFIGSSRQIEKSKASSRKGVSIWGILPTVLPADQGARP